MTKENNNKECGVADLANIAVSSATKAIFIDGLSSIMLTGHFAPNALTPYKVAKDILAAFTSFAIREYATNCVNEPMSIPVFKLGSGLVGGAIKYSLKGGNSYLGAFNNFLYEVYNVANLDSNYGAFFIETGEELIKVLLGLNQDPVKAFFDGLITSSAVVASVELAYLPADNFIKSSKDAVFAESSAKSSAEIPADTITHTAINAPVFYTHTASPVDELVEGVCLLGANNTIVDSVFGNQCSS